MSKSLISCYCSECYEQYFMSNDEILIPKSMSIMAKAKNIEDPKTWIDWLEHIQNYCPECRLKKAPESCIDNLSRMTKR
jgi:hypothetical protein